MSDESHATTEFLLPMSIVTKKDVAHIVSEVERIDNDLVAKDARDRVGADEIRTHSPSPQLEDFLELNVITLGDSQQRSDLIARLRRFKDAAMVIHVTFATAADQESLEQIVEWLRTSVSPRAVLSIGLQPGLVGGVCVRTKNHVHDLSVRQQLAGKRHLISEQVQALVQERQHV